MKKTVQYSKKMKQEAEIAANRKLYASRIWLDICADVHTSMLLERILYWFMPAKDGTMKVKVVRDGKYWIAKTRKMWADELRIKVRQYDKALKNLKEMGLVETIYSEYGPLKRVTHIRVNYETLEQLKEEWTQSYIEQNTINDEGVSEAEMKAAMEYERKNSIFFSESENYCEEITEMMKETSEMIETPEKESEISNQETDESTKTVEIEEVLRDVKAENAEKPETAFERIWNAYPNKMDKSQALTEYLAVRKKKLATDEVILDAVTKYSKFVEGTPKQYIKKFKTFLKYRCWENDYSIPDTASTQKKSSDTSYKDYEVFKTDRYDYDAIEHKSWMDMLYKSEQIPV